MGKLRSKTTGSESINITAEMLFDGKSIISREVSKLSNCSINVTDTFYSTEYGNPLVRFLLDPSINVNVNADGKITLRREGLEVLATFNSSVDNSDINIKIQDSYVAIEHNKSAITKEIIVTIKNNEDIKYLNSRFIVT